MSIDWPTFFLCTDAKFGDKMDFILVNIPAKKVIICTHRYSFLFAKPIFPRGNRKGTAEERASSPLKREVKESEREE